MTADEAAVPLVKPMPMNRFTFGEPSRIAEATWIPVLLADVPVGDLSMYPGRKASFVPGDGDWTYSADDLRELAAHLDIWEETK